MTNEELRKKWDAKQCTPEEEVQAMVRLFGMNEDQARNIASGDWKEEVKDISTDKQ